MQAQSFKRKDLSSSVITLENVISGRGLVQKTGWASVDFELTDNEINNLRNLICKGTQIQTYQAFDRHAAVMFKDLPSVSIMRRVTMNNAGHWEFCTGQSYPEEMAMLRKIFRET